MADVTRVCVVSEASDRADDMACAWEELGLAANVLPPSSLRALDPSRYALLWLVSGPAPHPLDPAGEAAAAAAAFLRAGRGVFAELARGFPGMGPVKGLRKAGSARLTLSETLGGGPGPGTILDPHDTLTLDAAPGAGRVAATMGLVRGVRRVLTPAAETWPGLVVGESGPGRWAWSALRISDFRRRELSPVTDWARLVTGVAAWLLPADARAAAEQRRIPLEAHTEPRAWAVPGSAVRLVVTTAPGARVTARGASFVEESPGRFAAAVSADRPGARRWSVRAARGGRARAAEVTLRVEDRRAAFRRALDRNIAWFERSGVMGAPDGSLGLTEWISGPDGEGKRIPYGKGQIFAPDRADCLFESGVAFLHYGRLAGSPRHSTIGRNLLWRVMDFQRLQPADQFAGLWTTRGRGGPPYEDDEALAVICALAGHRVSGDPLLAERGRLGAAAAVRVFGQKAPDAAEAADPGVEHAHDRGQMYAAWLYAYLATGDASYRDLALPQLERLARTFRGLTTFLISRTGEASRLLLPLALAYAATRDRHWAEEMADVASYLRSRRAPCGALQEQGGNAADKADGGDLGLTYEGTEPVTDQLYTTSWAAMNLWIAHKVTGEAAYRDDFEQLADYLVRIQLSSPNPRLDGGWTRAWDYELWETHASNADHSWTAWCLETGWTNAVIDIALALYLEDDSFLPLAPAVAGVAAAGAPAGGPSSTTGAPSA